MSAAEQKPPMTRDEWDAAMAEIHSRLASIPDDVPASDAPPWSLYWGVVIAVGGGFLLALSYGLGRNSYWPEPMLYFVAGFAAHMVGRAVANWWPRRGD